MTSDQAVSVITGDGVRERAVALLRDLTGNPQAQFRDGQLEAIEALVGRRERALVVQRTGWGKSAVYIISTALRREAGAGPTLVLSPLLSLMRDQEQAVARAGLRAAQLSSANVTQWDEVVEQLHAGVVDLLLVSPERLTNNDFRARVLDRLVDRIGLLVVDEAHCVSDWGHDFRPDYRRVAALLAELPADTPVVATTATANARVVADVAEQLGAGAAGPVPVHTIRGPLARSSLRLGVLRLDRDTDRLAWLMGHLGTLPGSGIIYTLTVAAAEQTATALRAGGHEVLAYTGRTDGAEREDAENALRDNRIKALVATSALGMGFDKPDLGFVVHLGAPSSPVSYYQQVGRAGRGIERAEVLLLPGPEDRAIWEWFAQAAMPRREQAQDVLDALARADGPLSVPALEAAADLRRTRLELLLKVLAVDGAVARAPGGWVSTGQPWLYDEARYRRVAQAREAEHAQMVEYLSLGAGSCRMAFLQQALDDATAEPCGRCDTCAGPWYPAQVDEAAAALTHEQVARPGVDLVARRQWPAGLDRLGVDLRGRIRADEQVGPGRALGRLSEVGRGGWLRALVDGAAADTQVSPQVLAEVVTVLREWPWERRPDAVCAVGSLRHPLLVGSLARQVADLGRMRLLPPLAATAATNGPGGNSAFRVASVARSLTVPPDLADALSGGGVGTVLLVDDLVDSGWTMTVAGRLLRRAGAPEVLPFALALAG